MSTQLPLILLVVLAPALLFFAAWLVKARTRMPLVVRLQKIQPEDLGEQDAVPVQGEYDRELESVGFEKVGDFAVDGFESQDPRRVYLHPAENTLALVSPLGIGLSKRPHLEFYTRFNDQSSLSTDQAMEPNFWAAPKNRELQRMPPTLPATSLWKLHQVRLKQLKAQNRAPSAIDKNAVDKKIEQDQQELLDYQASTGLFWRDQENNLLRPTWKFAFYFLFKIIDPLPFAVSLPRFFIGLTACAVVLGGFFMLAGWQGLAQFLYALPVPPHKLRYAIACLGAVLAGTLVGYLFRNRGVLWAGVAALAEFFLVKNAFPNAYLVILIAAFAGLVGNRITEYRLTKTITRLTGPLLMLLGLIIVGWIMLEKPLP